MWYLCARIEGLPSDPIILGNEWKAECGRHTLYLYHIQMYSSLKLQAFFFFFFLLGPKLKIFKIEYFPSYK